jgi:hypothetical protein
MKEFEFKATQLCHGWYEMEGTIKAESKKQAIKELNKAEGSIYDLCEICTEMTPMDSDMLMYSEYKQALIDISQMTNIQNIKVLALTVLNKEVTNYQIQEINKI